MPPMTATIKRTPTLPMARADGRSSLTEMSDLRYELVSFFSTFNILVIFLMKAAKSSLDKVVKFLQKQTWRVLSVVGSVEDNRLVWASSVAAIVVSLSVVFPSLVVPSLVVVSGFTDTPSIVVL